MQKRNPRRLVSILLHPLSLGVNTRFLFFFSVAAIALLRFVVLFKRKGRLNPSLSIKYQRHALALAGRIFAL